MATATNDIDDIRRGMARIRRDLHEDVRGVVASAEAVTDWKAYVRSYPWLAVGLAVAIGYFVVPRRRRAPVIANAIELPAVVEAVQAAATNAVQAATPAPPPEPKGKGIFGTIFGMITPIALRAAQGYATQFIGNWISQQQGQMADLMAGAGLAPGGPMPSPGVGPGFGPAPGPGFGAGPSMPRSAPPFGG